MSAIRRLIVARFLQNLAFAAPIQTLFFQARGLSLTEILALQSLLVGVAMALEVPTGIIGDRIGKKWSIVCGLACGLLAWFPWFVATDVWTFGLAFALLGASQAFMSGSDQALLYEHLETSGRKADMQKVYGTYLAMSTMGYAVAGLIGGFLASHQSMQEYLHLYVLTIAAQICAFALYFTIKEPHAIAGTTPKTSSIGLLSQSFQLLKTHSSLRRIAALSLLTTPFSVALFTLFQPYFVSSNVPAPWFGIALFISSLAASSTKIFAFRIEKAFGIRTASLLATILPGVLWILMALTFNPVAAVLLFILSDGAGNLRDPIFADYLNRHIPSHIRATTLSAISLLTSLYLLLLQPIIGALADVDMRYAFVLMGMLIVGGALLLRINDAHVSQK
jgi:MFS family permease